MRIAGTASALSLAALLALPTLAKAAPQFTSMNVALYTLDQGIAADTRVELSILPDAGGAAVGYLDINGQRFAPNKTVQEVVPATGTSFGMDELKREQILVKITPGAGYCSWNFGFDVVIHFDDGSEALMGSGTLTVSSGSPGAVVPLSEATIARPGFIGGVERFGFKLLSKDTGAGSTAASEKEIAHKNKKQFTHMDLTLATGNMGKDAGTNVEISIAPIDEGPAVAHLAIQGEEFAANSSSPEVVPPAGDGFTLDDLKHEQILVRVTSPNAGAWNCKFDAILHFADGSQALVGSGDLTLSGGSGEESVPLNIATVAHASSLLGGMEKIGFKLISRGSVTQTPEPDGSPSSSSTTVAKSGNVTASPKSSRGPRDFVNMEVKIRSGDQGKAADTAVEISIVPDGGGPALAYLNLQGQEIGANSSVKEVVPATPWTSFTAADLKRVQVVVKITSAGHATWTHGFDLALHFNDGTAALWSTGDLVLSDGNNQEVVSLSDATIAKHGLFGGVERIGFGLLNTIGSK